MYAAPFSRPFSPQLIPKYKSILFNVTKGQIWDDFVSHQETLQRNTRVNMNKKHVHANVFDTSNLHVHQKLSDVFLHQHWLHPSHTVCNVVSSMTLCYVH